MNASAEHCFPFTCAHLCAVLAQRSHNQVEHLQCVIDSLNGERESLMDTVTELQETRASLEKQVTLLQQNLEATMQETDMLHSQLERLKLQVCVLYIMCSCSYITIICRAVTRQLHGQLTFVYIYAHTQTQCCLRVRITFPDSSAV